MPANVFLTGPIRFGKSTLLSRAVSESGLPVGGYFVQRLMIEGQTRAFHLADVSIEPYVPDLEVAGIDKYRNIIGHIGREISWHPEVLDEQGASMIRQSLIGDKQLILMDELGRIELKAWNFQIAVREALDSRQLVLGVLKPEGNIFLDAIRNRKDVVVLDLTQMSHQAAHLAIRRSIKAVHQ